MVLPVIGLVHPGSMGAALGTALCSRGHQVLWCRVGRSEATALRAAAAGLTGVDDLATLRRRCDVILSVCPPHAAVEVAAAFTGYSGLFAEANAVSPATVGEIAQQLAVGGASVVDGGIVGPPPDAPDEPAYYRLFFSGEFAPVVAALFDGTVYQATVIQGPIGAASALKMAWSSWNKGTAALLLTTRRLACGYGAESALLEAWRESIPELAARSREAERLCRIKGWRWPGEMEQLAEAAETVGLPGGLYRGAAEIFRHARAEHTFANSPHDRDDH